MAALELVMVFPFLALLVGLIFLVAWAARARAEVASETRRAAFKKRPSVTPARPLVLGGSPDNDLARNTTKVEGRAGAFLSRFEVRSESAVLAGTWDRKSVTFESQPPFIPHLKPLGMIGENITNLSKFAGLDLGSNTSLKALGEASQIVGKLIAELQGMMQKYEGKLTQIVKKLEAITTALDELNGLVGPLQKRVTTQINRYTQITDLLSLGQDCLAGLGGEAEVIDRLFDRVAAKIPTAPPTIPGEGLLNRFGIIAKLGNPFTAVQELEEQAMSMALQAVFQKHLSGLPLPTGEAKQWLAEAGVPDPAQVLQDFLKLGVKP